MFAKFRKICTQ